MDLSYVGKIERGEQLPSLKTLQRLATALGVRLGQFFEAASSAHPSPARRGDGAERLWKMILRLRPGDLPLLEELIRVLVRHRQERARYARGGGPRQRRLVGNTSDPAPDDNGDPAAHRPAIKGVSHAWERFLIDTAAFSPVE